MHTSVPLTFDEYQEFKCVRLETSPSRNLNSNSHNFVWILTPCLSLKGFNSQDTY